MDSTLVEIVYSTSNELSGLELHGVDAGLSWLKGESIEFASDQDQDGKPQFKGNVILVADCEFRARGYTAEGDIWEEQNHKIHRLTDGEIEFYSSEEVLNHVEFTSRPPKPFAPTLQEIKLLEIKDDKYLTEFVFDGIADLEGMELHGVDSGLSWVKGESMSCKKSILEDGFIQFKTIVEIESSVEFKVRGYSDGNDFWADGQNIKLIVNDKKFLEIVNKEGNFSKLKFSQYPPLDYLPKLEDSIDRLSLSYNKPTQLYQYLIDLKNWFEEYYKDPKNQDLFDIISRMMRYMRLESREYQSKIIDDLIRPIIQTLQQIYKSAISHLDDDLESLIVSWRKSGFPLIFEKLPEQIKELNFDDIGSEKDKLNRVTELRTYN